MPQIKIDDENLAIELGLDSDYFTLDYNDEGRLEEVTYNLKEIPFEILPEWWLEKHETYNPY
jgi:hypothetical protein